MFAKESSLRRILPALLCAGVFMGSAPTIVKANTGGFSLIWGGRDAQPKKQLGYVLDYGTPGHLRDRWRLKLGKHDVAMSVIRIEIPGYFNGKFNEKRVSLRETPKGRLISLKKGKEIPVSEVTVDNEGGFIEVIPETPIPAGKRAELVLSGVKNPRSGGMFFFNCFVTSPGDVPIPRNVGTWVLSIYRS